MKKDQALEHMILLAQSIIYKNNKRLTQEPRVSNFKPYSVKILKRPVASDVLMVQLSATLATTLVAVMLELIIGFAVLLGGLISVSAQAFFNYSALRHFGDPDTLVVFADTVKAMLGRWSIIIGFSLTVVIIYEELNAGALYASILLVHLLGALALPLLVKEPVYKSD